MEFIQIFIIVFALFWRMSMENSMDYIACLPLAWNFLLDQPLRFFQNIAKSS